VLVRRRTRSNNNRTKPAGLPRARAAAMSRRRRRLRGPPGSRTVCHRQETEVVVENDERPLPRVQVAEGALECVAVRQTDAVVSELALAVAIPSATSARKAS